MPSDYGGARLALLVVALFYVGARRLEHLRYLAGDPLIARFCGVARLPTAHTVSNWLKQFTQATLAPLIQLNHDLVVEAITKLRLPRLTVDVDGTVVCTGAKVQWAFRGFNPHHRKALSYYPLVAHLAQTGHILRLKNRPGNVHDSKQAVAFLRELIDRLRARVGRAVPLEFRMDAAFFQREVLRLLTRRRCAYAIKVGYWSWLPLKQLAAEARTWLPLAPGVTGFEHELVDPAVEPAAPRDDLSQARAASDRQELSARPLHPRRWALRVLRRRHQHDPGPPRALRLRLWPRRSREDPR